LVPDPVLSLLTVQSKAVVAVITRVEGTSYRKVGTEMVICADGAAVGNLTNGCIEADLALQATRVLADGRPLCLRYGAGSPFFDIRLPCGGAIRVTLFLAPSDQTLRDLTCVLQGRGAMSLVFAPAGGSALRPGPCTGWRTAISRSAFRPIFAFWILARGRRPYSFHSWRVLRDTGSCY
jgi:xanthine dehydrogenase accessory factor